MQYDNFFSGEHMLTQDQKELLIRASSGYRGQDFSNLEKDDQVYYIRRVEDAIKEIQKANPHAFLFYYKNDEKVDIRERCLERNFYHTPLGITTFKSAVKHKIVFPDYVKISEGVK
jgi:hypothetical protein